VVIVVESVGAIKVPAIAPEAVKAVISNPYLQPGNV
jgi:hypothetical protein